MNYYNVFWLRLSVLVTVCLVLVLLQRRRLFRMIPWKYRRLILMVMKAKQLVLMMLPYRMRLAIRKILLMCCGSMFLLMVLIMFYYFRLNI